MEQTIKKVLQQIKEHGGDEVFTDSPRFKAMLKDLTRDERVINILSIAVCDVSAYNRLGNANANNNAESAINSLAEELFKKRFVDKGVAKMVLGCIADLHGYVYEITYSEPVTRVIGSTLTFGKYDWRVLDVKNGKALLISKDVTHVNKPYNETKTDVTWENCTLRQWLNRDFLNEFSSQEQSQICLSTIPNEDNQWYGTKGVNQTTDRIFLLSLDEVDNYFGNSGDYQNKRRKKYVSAGNVQPNSTGDYLLNENDKDRVSTYRGSQTWWWLRSSGGGSDDAAYVNYAGSVVVAGRPVSERRTGGGVRPALWLNLESGEDNNKTINRISPTVASPQQQAQSAPVYVSPQLHSTQQDSIAPIGSIYRFGSEDWLVLEADGNKRLLLSKDILENRTYHSELVSTNWEDCDLRNYLNGEFYNSFVPKDRARIIQHNVVNEPNPWWDTPGGNNTQDFIWLLSLEEICKYFGNSEGQLNSRTKRALAQQLKRDYWDKGKTNIYEWIDFYFNNEVFVHDENSPKRVSTYKGKASYWWLRSPGRDSRGVASVDDDGIVLVGGDGVSEGGFGVRPALWLNL